jgi:predicted nucleic acid-binding protein
MLLDTSGLLAALFPDQNRHRECAQALRDAEPPFVMSQFVLAELDYLILKYAGFRAEVSFLDEIADGVYELADFSAHDIHEARHIVNLYADLRIGLADAATVVLANHYRATDILTLDERHFRVLRPAAHRSFRILPADAR